MSDGRFWRVHWYRRGREFCNPGYDKRLRATSPDVILHPQFGKRQEVRENGMLQIEANEDLYQIDHAELYAELWGGHPGTVNKRVSVNGRSTYVLPEVGTKAGHCTYVYPRIDLKITDLVNGFNAFQWAVDNETFWGNLLLDNAALRVRLKPDHTDLAESGLADFAAQVVATPRTDGEGFTLSLESSHPGKIQAVHFQGFYGGYDENGDMLGRDWHGFTKHREPVAWLPEVWDTSMLPAQAGVAVRATIRFEDHPELEYITAPTEGLVISHPKGVVVELVHAYDLPRSFWSRANNRKTCHLWLAHPETIERAELHVVTWTGGPGDISDYFTLNGTHYPVADGHAHELEYSVMPVEPKTLKENNEIALLSDTEHHGIELLLPGPALMVRRRF
jgi:hypothetical protein